jgi:excisionase family DNA binding protein
MSDTVTTPFIGPGALADRWGVDKKTIVAAIHRGAIPCTRLGQRWLIPIAWVEARETQSDTAADES